MIEPLVSFIIPVYRPNLAFFKECLDSIVSQTYRNIEVIVVMDKSSSPEEDEKTISFIHGYGDRIKVIIPDHRNLSYDPRKIAFARNTGIKNANGEFVAVMDADDICEPTRIEEQVQFLSSTGVDIVGSYAKLIDEDRRVIGVSTTPSDRESVRRSVMVATPFLHPSVMFRKKVLLEKGMYDEMLPRCEDYELFLRLIAKGASGSNIPKPLLLLRENADSLSRSKQLGNNYYYLLVKLRGMKYGIHSLSDIFYFIVTLPAVFFNRKAVLVAKKVVGGLFSRSVVQHE